MPCLLGPIHKNCQSLHSYQKPERYFSEVLFYVRWQTSPKTLGFLRRKALIECLDGHMQLTDKTNTIAIYAIVLSNKILYIIINISRKYPSTLDKHKLEGNVQMMKK